MADPPPPVPGSTQKLSRGTFSHEFWFQVVETLEHAPDAELTDSDSDSEEDSETSSDEL